MNINNEQKTTKKNELKVIVHNPITKKEASEKIKSLNTKLKALYS